MYMQGFDEWLREQVKGRLQVKFPDHYHNDPYEWQDFHDCADFLLAGTAAESSVSTVAQAHPCCLRHSPCFQYTTASRCRNQNRGHGIHPSGLYVADREHVHWCHLSEYTRSSAVPTVRHLSATVRSASATIRSAAAKLYHLCRSSPRAKVSF
jgi:hypothetical protein